MVLSDGNTFYTNTAGCWNILFPQTLGSNDRIGVSIGEHNVQFGMAGELRSTGDLVVASIGQIEVGDNMVALTTSSAQVSTAQVQLIDTTTSLANAEFPEMVLENLNSRLVYPNIYPYTNIVYDLQGNQLKESIVL